MSLLIDSFHYIQLVQHWICCFAAKLRNYFDSEMSNSTNRVVYFDWKMVIYICTCKLQTMSYTIYVAKFEQTIIHQHVPLRQESQLYGWHIRNNNIVFACFNCTPHIINSGYEQEYGIWTFGFFWYPNG